MENTSRRGPAASRVGEGVAPLSAQRASVLESIQGRDGAVTAAQLAERLQLHVNTAREHLDALVVRGLAVREQAAPSGRGRPAWTYRAASLTEHDPRVREYAGLATALAGHISRTSSDPRADALAAGHAWGTELLPPGPPSPSGSPSSDPGPAPSGPPSSEPGPPAAGDGTPAEGARRQVTGLLERLGFDPAADPEFRSVALRRCPLLDAALRHPEVICGVHLGIVRGALESLGADPRGTDLEPFAEPGACRLTLARGA